MRKQIVVTAGLVAAAGAVVAGVAGTASATPASEVIAAPVVARGTFVNPLDIKMKVETHHGQEIVHVRDAADTVVQKIVLGAGGSTGWHSHYGLVVVVVQSGSLTLYDGHDETCTGTTYTAGQAFIDTGEHVHIGYNEGSEAAELWATYLDVPPGTSPRIDAPDPGTCG